MTAIRRRVYVLRPDALEILAGTDPKLRNGTAPNRAAIGTAAGIDPTTLLQICNRKIGLSSWVMAALVDLLMSRGVTQAAAERALFDLVTPDSAHAPAPRRERVAA